MKEEEKEAEKKEEGEEEEEDEEAEDKRRRKRNEGNEMLNKREEFLKFVYDPIRVLQCTRSFRLFASKS